MPPLSRWMVLLLRFAGTFNLLAGASMICLYHEGVKLLGMSQQRPPLAVQMVGILVALFGVGYFLVASHPIENKNILVLGWWSKALGSVAALTYVGLHLLPGWFAVVVFLADVIYLPPFLVILRRIGRAAKYRHREEH